MTRISHRRTPLVRTAIGLAAVLATALLAACGSSSGGGVTVPKVAAARTYTVVGFKPSEAVDPGKQTLLSFSIKQPSGKTLTDYRKCCEPHDGVDLVIVRKDNSHVQYSDSDIAADGTVTQPIVFPAPGQYRVVMSVFLPVTNPEAVNNFQLFQDVTVKGTYHPQPVPPFKATQVVDGYKFQVQGGEPHLHAIQPAFLKIKVTDPKGHPAVFKTWRGALAHAIFFRSGSLDYFHTHVCSPGAIYCTSAFGGTKVTGSSTRPGELNVGVLLPLPGQWRMYLITYLGGHELTVPYTLTVK